VNYKKTDVNTRLLPWSSVCRKRRTMALLQLGSVPSIFTSSFIDWEEGEQVYCVKQLDLLLPVIVNAISR